MAAGSVAGDSFDVGTDYFLFDNGDVDKLSAWQPYNMNVFAQERVT